MSSLLPQALGVACGYESYTGAERLAERILAWECVPPGSLRLPEVHVPHRAGQEAVDAFLRLDPSGTSADGSPIRGVFGYYGPPLSGKSTALRAAMGPFVRQLAASPDTTARVVYLPLGEHFKTAQGAVTQLATLLDYRPLYFQLLRLVPHFLRTDSAADHTTDMMQTLEQACALLRSQRGIRTVVALENIQSIVCSQHRMMLAPHIFAPVSAASDASSSNPPPPPSNSSVPTIAATPGRGHINLNQALQVAPDGDAMVSELIHAVHRGTRDGAYSFVFTSSSPVSAVKFRNVLGSHMTLFHQPPLTLNEGRELAQRTLAQFQVQLQSRLDALAAAAAAAAANASSPTATSNSSRSASLPRPPARAQVPPVHWTSEEFPTHDFLFTGASTKSLAGIPQWNDAEFDRIVHMVGLSPVNLISVFTAQVPVDQAKRVLASKLLGLTPYIFTNNFAIEEAWQSHGLAALRKLLSHRCVASRFLERMTRDEETRARDASGRSTPTAPSPPETSSTNRDSADHVHLELEGLQAAIASPSVNMLLESGALDVDLDTDTLSWATQSHRRAFLRMRARQRLPEVVTMCTTCGTVPPVEDDQFIDLAAALSVKLGKSNMWEL